MRNHCHYVASMSLVLSQLGRLASNHFWRCVSPARAARPGLGGLPGLCGPPLPRSYSVGQIGRCAAFHSARCFTVVPIVSPKTHMAPLGLAGQLAVTVQIRHFAGRQGGLKRRKAKKQPRQIQLSLGRRLEPFYPAGARQMRVRFVQNARGNVVFDPVLRKFYVFYYRQGVQVFRGFSARRGLEAAKRRALAFAAQMRKFYASRLAAIAAKHPSLDFVPISGGGGAPGAHAPPDQAAVGQNIPPGGGIGPSGVINYALRLQPSYNLAGVSGVFFHRGAWTVSYCSAGVRRYRLFPVAQLGFDNAYTQALQFLRFARFSAHAFAPRRTRTRKGNKLYKC